MEREDRPGAVVAVAALVVAAYRLADVAVSDAVIVVASVLLY